jgi:hypothetical protein
MIIKTYLINDNGGIKIKEHVVHNIPKPKKTLTEKKNLKIANINRKNMEETIIPLQLLSPSSSPSPSPLFKTKVPKNLSETEYNSLNKKNKSLIREKFFARICEIIGIPDYRNVIGSIIPFDKLNDPVMIRELFKMQFDLRVVFPSDTLTALHSGAVKKQTFPGVNIVRQIFKFMGYRMKPVNYYEGYVGSKKLLRREYHVVSK